MSHKLIPARFEQGLSAYQAGHGLDHVMEILSAIEEMHRAPDVTDEQHEEISHSAPSFVAGYASGLIDDVRSLALSPNVVRRGTKA